MNTQKINNEMMLNLFDQSDERILQEYMNSLASIKNDLQKHIQEREKDYEILNKKYTALQSSKNPLDENKELKLKIHKINEEIQRVNEINQDPLVYQKAQEQAQKSTQNLHSFLSFIQRSLYVLLIPIASIVFHYLFLDEVAKYVSSHNFSIPWWFYLLSIPASCAFFYSNFINFVNSFIESRGGFNASEYRRAFPNNK